MAQVHEDAKEQIMPKDEGAAVESIIPLGHWRTPFF